MSQSDEEKALWSNGVVLSFDFNVADLKTYFSERYPQAAYKVIKDFLVQNGFEHLKDSDYKNQSLDDIGATKLLYKFAKENKWFPFCLRKMDISPNVIQLDISRDLWAVRDDDWAKEHLEKTQKAADEKQSEKGSSMADWKKEIAKEKAQDGGAKSGTERIQTKTVKER